MNTIEKTSLRIVDIKGSNGLQYRNMILIETVEELVHYHENVYSNKIVEAGRALLSYDPKKEHLKNQLAGAALQLSEIKGEGELISLISITSNVQQAQLRHLLLGKTIVINPSGGWMTLSAGDILEDVKKEYTPKDINITKYDNGRHYYATVGGISVKDEDGASKWNTHDYAYNVSLKFLEDLNKKA